jgi:hypothetical protein
VVFQGRIIGEGDGATRYRVSRAWKGLREREVWVDQVWHDIPRYPLREYLIFAYGDVHGLPSEVHYDPDSMRELTPGPLPWRLFLRNPDPPRPAEPWVYADHYPVAAGHLHLHACHFSLRVDSNDFYPEVAAYLADQPEMALSGPAPWPSLLYPLQLVAKVLFFLEDYWPTEFRLALVTLAGVIPVAWWKWRVRRQGLSHVPRGRP